MTKKIGVALGAGSAKGVAHLGVLEVLEENHIPIDMVAGSSMGAIIGAIYAVGTDLSMLAKFLMAIDYRDYLDMAVPRAGRGGVIKGERLEEMIRIFTHDKTFEQTRIPFFCSAVDVETGERITLKEGKKLHECVRASMAIPGLFTPVRLDGRLLVDGGILERVPCAALREAGADVIIGVDVGHCGEERKLEHVSLLSLIDNTFDIMQWEIAKMRHTLADIMLMPRAREIMHGLSTENTEAGIREGRRAAEEALPRILEILKEKDIPLRK